MRITRSLAENYWLSCIICLKKFEEDQPSIRISLGKITRNGFSTPYFKLDLFKEVSRQDDEDTPKSALCCVSCWENMAGDCMQFDE